MMTSLEAMQYYTKILTGMVLMLNICLLLSIRMTLRHAKISSAIDTSEQGVKRWNGAKRGLAFLILMVVSMNGGAVLANYRLVNATRDIVAEMPGDAAAEMVIAAPAPPQTASK